MSKPAFSNGESLWQCVEIALGLDYIKDWAVPIRAPVDQALVVPRKLKKPY